MNDAKQFLTFKTIKYIETYSKNMLKNHHDCEMDDLEFIYDLSKKILNHREIEELYHSDFFKELKKLNSEIYGRQWSKKEFENNNILYSFQSENPEENAFGFQRAIRRQEKKKLGTSDLYEDLDKEKIFSYLSRYEQIARNFNSKYEIRTPKSFQEMYDLFRLTEEEKELVELIFTAHNIKTINSHIFHEIGVKRNNLQIELPFKTFVKVQHLRIEYMTNIPHQNVKKQFKKTGRLFKTNILTEEDDPSLTEFIKEYLSGDSQESLMNSIFEKVDLSESFPLEANQHQERDLFNLKKMYNSKNSAAVLLKGLPGTGKTETAKSLAKELNFPLFNLRHTRKNDDHEIPPRKMAMYLIQEVFKNTEVIFLIDECEDLIESREEKSFYSKRSKDENVKSYINEYLDENQCKIIFIANNTEGVDPSTMRRFNYILTFKEISPELREKLISNLFKKENANLLGAEEIRSLAINSKLNIGHFGIALKTALKQDLSLDEKKNLFLDIVNNHSKEFTGGEVKLKKINQHYSVDGLNVDHDLGDFISRLAKNYKKMIACDTDSSITACFLGPSGTGKTEAVKAIAQSLNLELVIKQGSDIVSKYVGETEKNIRRIFSEAEGDNKILFIDEIDAITGVRNNESRSWEIGQVNEFLVCLENFKGIFICATNSTERMDPATLRRFLYKIKFDYLDSEGNLKFYSRFFNEITRDKISNDQLQELMKIKHLTPGDFNNVRRKIIYEDDVTHNEILRLLRLEVSHKKFHTRGSVGLGAERS